MVLYTPGHSTKVPELLQTEDLSLLFVVYFIVPWVEARVRLLLICRSIFRREYVRKAREKLSEPESMLDDALSSSRYR